MGYDLVQTVDLFFKIHFVFNLNFDPNLVPMMNFMKCYIYELHDDSFVPSTTMIDIWTKLNTNNK